MVEWGWNDIQWAINAPNRENMSKCFCFCRHFGCGRLAVDMCSKWQWLHPTGGTKCPIRSLHQAAVVCTRLLKYTAMDLSGGNRCLEKFLVLKLHNIVTLSRCCHCCVILAYHCHCSRTHTLLFRLCPALKTVLHAFLGMHKFINITPSPESKPCMFNIVTTIEGHINFPSVNT